MTSSHDVFDKRREGQLEEAYQLALERMVAPDKGEWDFIAFGWCLVDLIKRDVKAEKNDHLEHYRQQLDAIDSAVGDEVFNKQRRWAISLCRPDGRLINKAKQLSKSGHQKEATQIYRQLCASGEPDEQVKISFGWELYKLSKSMVNETSIDVNSVKRNLNDYLKLKLEKPSLLHSCVLQIACKLAGHERFNLLAFSRLWELDYLRKEDWNRFVTDDRKVLPSLAEKAIQASSKEAAKTEAGQDPSYILPYLDGAIKEYPDNIWLSLNKAKILLRLGNPEEALKPALEVARTKSNDFWAWDLIGDISAFNSDDVALSCYCKALLCSSDDKFTGKVRLKLANLLSERENFSEAKYEINRVAESKEREGYKIPSDAENLMSQPWYAEAALPSSNDEFYNAKTEEAEALLFNHLSWIAGNLGEIFTVDGQEKKPKRKLFLKTSSDPIEVTIPAFKFEGPNSEPGHAIRVKGEWDSSKRFQVYLLARREQVKSWDVFKERIGVVDHVNREKKVIHFIVDKNTDGVIPFSDLDSSFTEGDAILVTLSKYWSKQGGRFRVWRAECTDKKPDPSLRKDFYEQVEVRNGLGFTTSNIFIPPPIVNRQKIEDSDLVSGVALLNFDKKHSTWGWKAISAERASLCGDHDGL